MENHLLLIFSTTQSAVEGIHINYEEMKEINPEEFMELYNDILLEDAENKNIEQTSTSRSCAKEHITSEYAYYVLPSLSMLLQLSLPEDTVLYECGGSYLLYARSCMLLDDFFDRFHESGAKRLISQNISKITKGE